MATLGIDAGLDESKPGQDVTATSAASSPSLPRVTIKFCTQCKWMLRAAYYAQELLSTFSTALGEVALQPSTGGVFIVQIQTTTAAANGGETHPLWDRKLDGGFPETKELKRRVRDFVEPGRNLGHVDRDYARPSEAAAPPVVPDHGAAVDGRTDEAATAGDGSKTCEDCS